MAAVVGMGLAIALAGVGRSFTAWLLIYIVVTTAYSLDLKRRLLIDVICLAGLYTHRVVAGAIAGDVVLTPWLLAFSMFFFLSLAFAKRYSELMNARVRDVKALTGRSYRVEDLDVI